MNEVFYPLSFKGSYEFKHLVVDFKKCIKILNMLCVYIYNILFVVISFLTVYIYIYIYIYIYKHLVNDCKKCIKSSIICIYIYMYVCVYVFICKNTWLMIENNCIKSSILYIYIYICVCVCVYRMR